MKSSQPLRFIGRQQRKQGLCVENRLVLVAKCVDSPDKHNWFASPETSFGFSVSNKKTTSRKTVPLKKICSTKQSVLQSPWGTPTPGFMFWFGAIFPNRFFGFCRGLNVRIGFSYPHTTCAEPPFFSSAGTRRAQAGAEPAQTQGKLNPRGPKGEDDSRGTFQFPILAGLFAFPQRAAVWISIMDLVRPGYVEDSNNLGVPSNSPFLPGFLLFRKGQRYGFPLWIWSAQGMLKTPTI